MCSAASVLESSSLQGQKMVPELPCCCPALPMAHWVLFLVTARGLLCPAAKRCRGAQSAPKPAAGGPGTAGEEQVFEVPLPPVSLCFYGNSFPLAAVAEGSPRWEFVGFSPIPLPAMPERSAILKPRAPVASVAHPPRLPPSLQFRFPSEKLGCKSPESNAKSHGRCCVSHLRLGAFPPSQGRRRRSQGSASAGATQGSAPGGADAAEAALAHPAGVWEKQRPPRPQLHLGEQRGGRGGLAGSRGGAGPAAKSPTRLRLLPSGSMRTGSIWTSSAIKNADVVLIHQAPR